MKALHRAKNTAPNTLHFCVHVQMAAITALFTTFTYSYTSRQHHACLPGKCKVKIYIAPGPIFWVEDEIKSK